VSNEAWEGPSLRPSVGAVAHLRADPALAAVIDRVGRFERAVQPDLWRALARAIVGQQLSMAAAGTIDGRFACLGAGGYPTPAEVAGLEEAELRGCGLSRAKAAYIRDLAAHWSSGSLDPERISRLPDEEAITALTGVHGIGRWTAEMALIFSLRRPDVLPVDDLGFRVGVQRAYDLPERPGAAALRDIAEPWRPYRSVATLYLWESLK